MTELSHHLGLQSASRVCWDRGRRRSAGVHPQPGSSCPPGHPNLAPHGSLPGPGEAAWLGRSDFTTAFCSGGCEGSKPEPFALPGAKQGTKLRFQLLFPALPSACHDLLCLPGPHGHPQHPSACRGRRSHAPSVNEQARHTHTHTSTRVKPPRPPLHITKQQ